MTAVRDRPAARRNAITGIEPCPHDHMNAHAAYGSRSAVRCLGNGPLPGDGE
jgi:hypothetical protein